MHNHHEKARDMARSVLPSTRRRGARMHRSHAHARERHRVRAALHEVATYDDPDDYEGDLTWEARRAISEMVGERRAADKVAPLMRWAERTVERDPVLRDASFEQRVAHFRRLLPKGLIGRHALTHLAWVLDPDPYWPWRPHQNRAQSGPTVRQKLEAIVKTGRHGELNRRLRHESSGFYSRRVRVPAQRIVDEEHPEPGMLIPAYTEVVNEPITTRFLLGAHDIDAFSKEGELSAVHELYEELVRDGLAE